ncbi:hypothetical protein BDW71DRAFT_185613, partial [Aspergillus fruticulosus]
MADQHDESASSERELASDSESKSILNMRFLWYLISITLLNFLDMPVIQAYPGLYLGRFTVPFERLRIAPAREQSPCIGNDTRLPSKG